MNTKFRKVLKRLKADVASYRPEESISIKSKSRDVSHGEIINRLRYNKDTGKFYWRNGHRAGLEAGHCANTRGKSYIRINFNRDLILAHVLAWFVVHGVWPPSELDHIDGDGTNNKISNLRLGSRDINNSNTRRRKDSKVEPNICLSRGGNFIVQVKFNKRTYWLGTFPTLELAVKARNIAEKLIPRSENHRQELDAPLLKTVERSYDAAVIYGHLSSYTIIDNMQIPDNVESIEI